MTNVRIFLRLTRFPLSLAISFSALVGAMLGCGTFNLTCVSTFMGVWLLSGAASALNQLQEMEVDALMERTKNRPLPSKQIAPVTVVRIASILGFLGTALLFSCATLLASALAVFNLLWYNLVYTPLKKRSSLALLAGALTGALPPMIGWSATGGNPFSPTILLIALFMYLWQIPHFGLLLKTYGKEYEKAGFCTLHWPTDSFFGKYILLIWITSTSVCSLFFPLFGIVTNIYLVVFLLIINIWLIFSFVNIVFSHQSVLKMPRIYFYQAVVLLILLADLIF